MISVKWGAHYRFVDMYKFIDSSLDKMIKDVSKENTDAFLITKELFKKVYPWIDLEKIDIAKGGMCYNYLNEQTIKEPNLPSIEHYTNDMTGEQLPEQKYALCQKVHSMFRCQNLGDDVIAYLWSDVSQMMDCWNAYKKISLDNFHLDLGNFMTLPSLTGSGWLLSLNPRELVYKVDNIDQYNIAQGILKVDCLNVGYLGQEQTNLNFLITIPLFQNQK